MVGYRVSERAGHGKGPYVSGTMNNVPTYTFDWRLKEHAQVISILMRERLGTGLWRVARWIVIIILALATVVTLASAALGDFGSVLRLGPLVLLVGAMTFWFDRITARIRAWQVQRMDPAVRKPITHVFEESGLRVVTTAVETHLKWDGMHKVRETPDLFMFYYSERIAYYLPKRVVGGTSEVDEVRRQIRDRLPPSVPFEG